MTRIPTGHGSVHTSLYVQPELLDVDEPEKPPTPAEKFEQFHHDNPAVYQALCDLARQWINSTGRRKIGIGALVERVRWDIAIATSDPDFKINNNHRPFYARLIMAQEPDLADVFDLRTSIADEWTPGARDAA